MIRPAEPADIPGLVRMIAGLAAHHGDGASVSGESLARDLFGPVPWLLVHVAAGEEGLSGYLAMTRLARLQWGQRGLDIHHLFVSGPARGTGLGRRLVEAAKATARAQGCSYLTVTALEENTEAQAFYAHCGFAPAPFKGVRFAYGLGPEP